MSKEKLGQEPVFPISDKGYPTHLSQLDADTAIGISKRFYAACAVTQGLMSNPYLSQKMGKLNTEKVSLVPEIVKAAYEYADELLKQENK